MCCHLTEIYDHQSLVSDQKLKEFLFIIIDVFISYKQAISWSFQVPQGVPCMAGM